MPLTWKALGRTLEIITIVLLVVAVRYLWVRADSAATATPESPQVEIQVPEPERETFVAPYQPPVPTRAETHSYQPPVSTSKESESYPQAVESTPPIYAVASYVPLAPGLSCNSSPTPTKRTNPSVGSPNTIVAVAATPPTPTKITNPHDGSPNVVVEEAAMLLDAAIRGHREELAEDQQALFAVIDEILLTRFDRRLAAQRVLAKHWKTASAEERDRFISAFYSHLMCQYAEAVLEFDIQRLKVVPISGDTSTTKSMVKTFMSLDDGTKGVGEIRHGQA